VEGLKSYVCIFFVFSIDDLLHDSSW